MSELWICCLSTTLDAATPMAIANTMAAGFVCVEKFLKHVFRNQCQEKILIDRIAQGHLFRGIARIVHVSKRPNNFVLVFVSELQAIAPLAYSLWGQCVLSQELALTVDPMFELVVFAVHEWNKSRPVVSFLYITSRWYMSIHLLLPISSFVSHGKSVDLRSAACFWDSLLLLNNWRWRVI